MWQRIINVVLFSHLCLWNHVQAADTEAQWRLREKESKEILVCCKNEQELKFKVIAENDDDCLISFIAAFNHIADSQFQVLAILLDADGFEILRRPIAECAANYVPPVTSPQKTVEPVHSHYNLKGTFSVPCGFFERTKDVELRFYKS